MESNFDTRFLKEFGIDFSNQERRAFFNSY